MSAAAALVAAALGLAAGLAGLLVGRGLRSRRLPAERPWHRDRVPSELRAADYRAGPPLDELLSRERRLLDAVERRHAAAATDRLLRYHPGGPRAPAGRNRSLELAAGEPRAAALLLHGLSDSPYHVRPLAELARRSGASTLALRLPGHGTAPGGLLTTRWQDWREATRYGVAAARRGAGAGAPLWLGGFSTGAALLLHHCLRAALRGERVAERLILVAPALSVGFKARFALWHRSLSWAPYFTRLKWHKLAPELDPCKYNSFPKRAAAELHRLTRSIARLTDRLSSEQRILLPRILAFHSLADDTVALAGVVRFLVRAGRHADELVVFDVNRSRRHDGLVRGERYPLPRLELGERGEIPLRLTVITNERTRDETVEEVSWPAGSAEASDAAAERRPLELAWPPGVLSLSHLGLGMPPDDPVYGEASELGGAAPLGERGVTALPAEDLLRLRYNPFWELVADRVEAFLNDR